MRLFCVNMFDSVVTQLGKPITENLTGIRLGRSYPVVSYFIVGGGKLKVQVPRTRLPPAIRKVLQNPLVDGD